jgi:glycine cleavage system H protein
MKKVGEYLVQEGLYYTGTHEWAKVEGDKVRIGIADFAQRNLKDLVYVEFIDQDENELDVGSEVEAKKQIGAVESVKATAEVFSPVSGKILEINRKLENSPEMANNEPYGEGWVLVIKPSNLEADLKNLMDDSKYMEFLKTAEPSH